MPRHLRLASRLTCCRTSGGVEHEARQLNPSREEPRSRLENALKVGCEPRMVASPSGLVVDPAFSPRGLVQAERARRMNVWFGHSIDIAMFRTQNCSNYIYVFISSNQDISRLAPA